MTGHSKKSGKSATLFALIAVGVGVGIWVAQTSRSSFPNDADAPANPAESQPDGTAPSRLISPKPNQSGSSSSPSASGQTSQMTQGISDSSTPTQMQRGQMNAENNFSRAEFFKPVDWGSNLQTLASKEPQVLKFNAACNNHPRHAPQAQPADWAEAFTHSDAMQRWPAPATHVIDWNQFWKTKDKGLQISIRWNFELPARYSVLGYSFAADKPDGYGAPLFPEKSDLTWDDAKAFVLELEKKIVADGGTPTTRTMSVAEKAFNPGEVSPDEIQRAEFTNSRVRGAQTGKMSCNANSAELTTLSCACWF